MNVDVSALQDAPTPGGGKTPPCAGLTSNALPEAQNFILSESSPTRDDHSVQRVQEWGGNP